MKTYTTKGYVLLPGLVPADITGAYLRLLKSAINRAAEPPTMDPSPVLTKRTYEIYGYQYLPMLTFLWGLTPTIRKLTGLDLLPTYAYTRVYQRGDTLRVHADRDACEHSLSLTLGYSDGIDWPLDMGLERLELPIPILDTFQGMQHISLSMRPGDAVLYRGVQRAHGRLMPNPNRWSAHMFLHWVERNGPFSHCAFDNVAMDSAVDFVFPGA
jgi:hypothetical protein